MRRLCEVADIAPAVLYNRIHFIHRRCLIFARHMEKPLVDGKKLRELRIAVDRQEHVFNWSSQMDRRNTQLSAVASAENRTGYVFGMHLDYDPSIDPFEADLHAREIGDYETEWAYRHYSRIWLPRDWEHDSAERLDRDSGDDTRLPAHGVRVYREYTLIAHFFFLKRLLRGAERVVFSLDPEPGIRAACLTAFRDWLSEDRIEAYLVSINKGLTVDKKRLALAARQNALERARLASAMESLSDWQVAAKLMEAAYRKARESEVKPAKRWIQHPLPNMGEPEKAVVYLTERNAVDAEKVAQMGLGASLHAVDRFFMQLRRRVSLLERPIATASNAGRVWHGGAAYNPEIAVKLMEIFRVAYNYSLKGKGGETAAMRLGLADRPFTLSEILDGRS